MGPDMTYFKDPRTGICFAGQGLFSTSAVMTSVPGSEAVDRVIAEQAQTRQARVP